MDTILSDELIQKTYREVYKNCMKEIEWNEMERCMKKTFSAIYNYKEKDHVNGLYKYYRSEQCSREKCTHQNSLKKQSYVLPFIYYDMDEQIEETANVCKDCYIKSSIKIIAY